MYPFAHALRASILFLSALAALALPVNASAAPLPAPARAEVDALLVQLQSSGCEFNRNGTWHNATDAKAHLLRKLDYLEGKNLVQSAEQFIEQGASSSSMSGKSYEVRCGATPAVPSQRWLLERLKTIRATAPKLPARG